MNDPGTGTGGPLPPPGASADAAPPDVNLGRVWTGVAAQVWRRHPGWAERAIARLTGSPGLARALLTTPSLLIPWLLATVVVLATGAIASARTGTPIVALLAPGVAGVGIAYAYGPGVDPAWELSCSMAVSDRMVLLARAMSVFAVNAVLGLAMSALSGAAAAVTFGWLIPMTAVCGLALAAATLTRSAELGVTAGLAAWAATVTAGRLASGTFSTVATSSALFLPYLAVAACSAAVVLYATRIPRGSHE